MVPNGSHARNWSRCAAAGIAAVCLAVGNAHADDAQSKNPNTQAQKQTSLVSGAVPAHSTQYKPLCEHPPTRDDAEYCENAKAAKAANESANWAFWQLIVGGIGVAAVAWTLIYTAKAANAAKIAAEAIPLLERPYIFIHGNHGVEALAQDKYRPRIVYNVSNNGKLSAKVEHVRIRFGLEAHGNFPPSIGQGDHVFLQRPIIPAEEERFRTIYEIGESPLATRTGVHKISSEGYELVDGVIFQVVITYRGPAPTRFETAQCWRYIKSIPGWVEVDDPTYTYMR